MDAITPINYGALRQLKQCRHFLTAQQYKTIKGQILAGETDGALRGLQKIKQRRGASRDRKA